MDMNVSNVTFEATESVVEDWSCGGTLLYLATTYANYYHPYCVIIVCAVGVVLNTLNIIVLTRKDMATAPINRLLTALAWADMLLMIEYMPSACYYHIESKVKEYPYWGAVYILFHIHYTQIFHTISICLTLSLAIWRFLAIRYMEKNHVLCSHQRCTATITTCFTLPFFLCAPYYPTLKINTAIVLENNVNYSLYHVVLSDLVNEDKTLLTINFWYLAIVMKLLPCLILIVISIWLIRTLFRAKKRRGILKGYDNKLLISCSKDNVRTSKVERRADRTTKMLIAVLFLFLLTELPQGLFALVIGLRGKELFLTCYQHYGEVMDILALLNGCINFVLYCCMNRMFRVTFGVLFKSKIFNKWSTSTISDTQSAIVGGHRTNTTTV
ncbi:G-protein coupled receptor dmsr-1-like isoform X2 [Cylas formicarius]|uniref:G-protein coupled receptor dmsr-1-like isoform X2 n=1 Tax=Cylas formicarius TaxID=197179 RepID=UPI002958C5AF|nr:G-protein coupled receptor dmsr-1-like isoform X2 [Cylas formicarius]